MERISLKNYSGSFSAKSSSFTANGVFDEQSFEFTKGINVLKGDIDSGNFGISYGMAMRKYDKDALFLFPESKEYVDGKLCDLKDHSQDICYMDKNFPLFKSKMPLNNIVKKRYGKRLEELGITFESLYEMFGLDAERCNRRLDYTGTMCLRGMAAIGYLEGKKVFCFPWMSKHVMKCFWMKYYVLEPLKKLGMIVILPTNYDFGDEYRLIEMRDCDMVSPLSLDTIVLDMRFKDDGEIISKIEEFDNLEEADSDGRTWLINAALSNKAAVVRYLLDRGANIHAKSKDALTALHAAVIANDIEIIKILSEAGADVNAKDIVGNTPIMLTAFSKNFQAFNVLIDYGADPDLKNDLGASAKDMFGCTLPNDKKKL